MKIRRHRKKEWWFYPAKESSLYKGRAYRFKYKSKLMQLLNNNLEAAINGEVHLEKERFGGSYRIRMWDVWYNEKAYLSGANIKIELRQLLFRGRKYVRHKRKISKISKRYFAFSEKRRNLLAHIGMQDGNICPKNARNLCKIFNKSGFNDFEPNAEEWKYINGHIADGIDFWHWSDRCGWLRMKTIVEYFRRNDLIPNFKLKQCFITF